MKCEALNEQGINMSAKFWTTVFRQLLYKTNKTICLTIQVPNSTEF